MNKLYLKLCMEQPKKQQTVYLPYVIAGMLSAMNVLYDVCDPGE